jgi:hypothetical protein
MAIENVQQLLTEQLGKNGSTEIFTTAAQTVVASITVADATGEAALHTTLPAGTTLFMNVTAITLTSGIGIGYYEGITT